MEIFLTVLESIFSMIWSVTWALCLGFLLSAVIQATVSTATIQRQLGKTSARSLGLATLYGAVSSSCSYAAASMSKTLFSKGASLPVSSAFLVSSTNLVLEIMLVIWILMGWQFVVGELLGGLVLVLLIAVFVPLIIRPRQIERMRLALQMPQVSAPKPMGGMSMAEGSCGEAMHGASRGEGKCGAEGGCGADMHGSKAESSEGKCGAEGGCGADMHGSAKMAEGSCGGAMGEKPAKKTVLVDKVCASFRMEVSMVGKDILIGLVIAGALGVLVPNSWWSQLFMTPGDLTHPGWGVLVWNAIIGPVIAILAFVCSVGNIVLASVLWAGGISFGGVMAFILADIITLPMIKVYASYYGWPARLICSTHE